MALYYNDTHVEDIVFRKDVPMGKLLSAVSTLMAVILGVLTMYLLPSVFQYPQYFFLQLALCAVFAFLAYYNRMHSRVDFEYVYTNGVLDVAAIYAKEKRKELLSIKMEEIVVAAPSHSEPIMPYVGRKMRTYDCTSHIDGAKYFCMIFKNPDHNNAEEKLLFEPSSDLLDAMWRMQPQAIHKER